MTLSSLKVAWKSANLLLELPGDQIHVWRIRLVISPARHMLLRSFLSEEEKARAARFHFDRDRSRFIVAHGTLRELLAYYLRISPPEVKFRYEQHGKPALDLESRTKVLNFNLSHSSDLALCGVGWNRKIGIDIEKVEEHFGGEELARRYFSVSEAESLLSLPLKLQAASFFNCWTRKEAYVKARGDGLLLPLDSFDVTLAPGVPGRFLRGVDQDWQLVAFSAALGFPAALVYNGSPCKIRFLSRD